MKRNELENQIKEIIEKEKLAVSVDCVMDYWTAKQWKTKNGTPVQSLRIAVHVCNSIYVSRQRRLAEKQVVCASLF